MNGPELFRAFNESGVWPWIGPAFVVIFFVALAWTGAGAWREHRREFPGDGTHE